MVMLPCRTVFHHGDCMDVLPRFGEATVDVVIADPPYGIGYQSAWRTDKNKRHAKIANDNQPFVWWLPQTFRVLKESGCLLCFCRWDVQEAFRQAIGWAGMRVGAQLIWDREKHGMGDLTGCPAPQHDVIWFAVKGKYQFHGTRPTSVIRCNSVAGEHLLHPNQKPTGVIRELIRRYCPEGGVVLDPFIGSGTTAVACLREGRNCVGIDVSEKYLDVARSRVDKVRKEL